VGAGGLSNGTPTHPPPRSRYNACTYRLCLLLSLIFCFELLPLHTPTQSLKQGTSEGGGHFWGSLPPARRRRAAPLCPAHFLSPPNDVECLSELPKADPGRRGW
jgi:hypothetical protein